MNLINRIKDSKLTKNQISISTILTRDLKKTAFLSIVELAKECKTSISAITRFTHKIGLSGFPELKKELEQLYKDQMNPYYGLKNYPKDQENQTILSECFKQDLENIHTTKNLLSEEKIIEVVTAIQKSSHIYVAGIGTTEILVDNLCSFLNTFNKPNTKLKSFGISKKAEIIKFKKNELMICISFNKLINEVKLTAEIAKSNNLKVISITDGQVDPLALLSDISLISTVKSAVFGNSLTAPLFLINVIGNTFAMSDQENNLKNLEEMEESWSNLPIFYNN